MFLDIRVFNPAREKLAIRRAEAVVDESFPDLEPILLVQDGNHPWTGGVTCEIVNFGAGRVGDCEFAFNILPSRCEAEVRELPIRREGGVSPRSGLPSRWLGRWTRSGSTLTPLLLSNI